MSCFVAGNGLYLLKLWENAAGAAVMMPFIRWREIWRPEIDE